MLITYLNLEFLKHKGGLSADITICSIWTVLDLDRCSGYC